MTDDDRLSAAVDRNLGWYYQGQTKALSEVLIEMDRFQDDENRWEYLKARVARMLADAQAAGDEHAQ